MENLQEIKNEDLIALYNLHKFRAFRRAEKKTGELTQEDHDGAEYFNEIANELKRRMDLFRNVELV